MNRDDVNDMMLALFGAFLTIASCGKSRIIETSDTHKHRCGIEPDIRVRTKRGPVIRYKRTEGCGLVWEHGNDMAENDAAHRCPGCGREQWVQYPGKVRPGKGVRS